MCTEFIHYIASSTWKKLMEDISKFSCVSLLIDDSTYISVTASVIVYMRYIAKGTVSESYVGVEELSNETADDYIGALNSLSERLGIKLFDKGKVVGLATDGARTMLGCHRGVVAKLTKDNPHLVVIHCVVYRLQLAVLDSLKAVHLCKKSRRLSEGYTYIIILHQSACHS